MFTLAFALFPSLRFYVVMYRFAFESVVAKKPKAALYAHLYVVNYMYVHTSGVRREQKQKCKALMAQSFELITPHRY